MKIFVNALSTPPIGGSAGEWVKLGKFYRSSVYAKVMRANIFNDIHE